MRHIGDGSLWSRERVVEVADAQSEHWAQHGFGWRVAVEKASDRQLGFIALSFAEEGTVDLDRREYELGWWLDPAVWGRGFAREGAAALRDEAFSEVGAPSVVARMQPDNAPSLNVAEAVGLSFDRQTTGRAGEPLVIYRLAASACSASGS